MKSKVPSYDTSHTSVKPIHISKISNTIANNKYEHHTILDKFKHGLQETGSFIKDHTIGELEKAAHVIDNKGHIVVDSIKNNISKDLKLAGSAIKTGANNILKGAEAVENGLLPSGSSIIMETGLAIGGLAIIGLLAFKFL